MTAPSAPCRMAYPALPAKGPQVTPGIEPMVTLCRYFITERVERLREGHNA